MKKFFATALMFAFMITSSNVDAAKISCADSTFAFETINQTLREWNCTPLKS